MEGFWDLCRRFGGDEQGATAIEYGLIAGLIAIAVIGAMVSFGDSLSTMFNRVSSEAGGAMDAAGG